jgi:hypothetical protein
VNNPYSFGQVLDSDELVAFQKNELKININVTER